MKILITTDWYKPVINGVVTSVVNLENCLRKQGHDVRVLTLSQTIHSHKEGNVYYFRSVNANKIYPDARLVYSKMEKYVREILEWQPDVVHSQCEFSSFFFAKKISKRLGIPLVHTYHTVYEDYTHYFSPSKRIGKNVAQVLSRTFCNHVDSVIVPTEKVKELLLTYDVITDVNVIPSGIDLDRFEKEYSLEEIEAIKRQYEIPPEDKVIVVVGRMAKEKNHQEIIEYFGAMNLPDVTLFIVGGGPYMEKLQSLAQSQINGHKIRFSGMVSPEEIGKYYQVGHVFACASRSETQGITYVEALSSGLACICRRDECLEHVIVDGENGFIYDSFEEYKEKLMALLSDDKYLERIGEKARESTHKFGVEEFAKNVMAVYERCKSRL